MTWVAGLWKYGSVQPAIAREMGSASLRRGRVVMHKISSPSIPARTSATPRMQSYETKSQCPDKSQAHNVTLDSLLNLALHA